MAEGIDIARDIEEALDRQPFQPFTLVGSSGDRYEVTGRHQVAAGRAVLIVLPPDSTSIYLRTSQLVAVEIAAPAA